MGSPAAAGLAGEGAPLEPGIRDHLSTSFGHDFSPVRVHVGPHAEQAARDLGARAYTVGNDVVFGAGAYDPLSARGRALIAHELAHVAQHRGHPSGPSFLRTNPGAAVPPADARLERQAERAAALHAEGLPRGWAWERTARPFLGRADVAWTDTPEPHPQIAYAGGSRIIAKEQWGDDDRAVRINMGDFVVPAQKGPWADHYNRIARAGGLQATTDVSTGRIRAALWQQRAPTPELRRLWLLRVQWPSGQAGTWWHEAGGQASPGGFDPTTKAGPAQIDHIVELQLGGTNVPENLAPHTGPDNEASGRIIWQRMRESAQAAATIMRGRHPAKPLRQLTLWFSGAVQEANYVGAEPLPVLPAADPQRAAAITARKGQAVKALQVHATALADLAAGTRPNPAERTATAATQAALSSYPVSAGPSTATLRVAATPVGDEAIENSEVPENHAARELISGLVMGKLNRPRAGPGPHVVTGYLNDPAHPVREGQRLPMVIRGPATTILSTVGAPGPPGRLNMQGGSKQLQFAYPYLSTGQMTLRTTEAGLVGVGTLTPSVPLLRRVPITVELDRNGLRGSVRADPAQLSLPPFRVTEAALTLNLAPTLSAGGHVAFALGTIVTGRVEGGVDAQGLFARGTIQGRIPGLDEASGRLEYRPATGATGFVVARASRPSGLVRGGEVRVDFADNAWTAGGQVNLMLPGDSPAQLTVRRVGERVVYGGRATLNVPGLRPIGVDLTYDGQRVTGSATTTFTLLGATGDIVLSYRDGQFTGQGSVRLQRGRFTGTLNARLNEQGVISGTGSGSLEIRPGLVGTVGIEYPPDRRLRVTGEMRFPTYRFMDQRGARYQLFQRSLPEIPIFAIPLGIGSVGLVATLGGGLAVRYSFGPGELRDMVIRAGINPLEEDMNAVISAEARLVIPAEAGLELSVRAGIGASVAIARATGGITLTGGVLLRGGLDARAQLSYARSVLTFDASARISVQPVLTLRIDADITIEAAVGGPWPFPYQLASYSYATGLEFGMIAPFHYQSDQALRLPAASDIQWIVPDIDVRALAGRVAGQVRSGLGI